MTTQDTIDPVDVAIGGRVRERREARRMTQDGLAKAVGVTFQQVQKYERGVNRIAAARLIQMAAALETAVADLVGETIDGDSAKVTRIRSLCRRLSDAELDTLAAFLAATGANRP